MTKEVIDQFEYIAVWTNYYDRPNKNNRLFGRRKENADIQLSAVSEKVKEEIVEYIKNVLVDFIPIVVVLLERSVEASPPATPVAKLSVEDNAEVRDVVDCPVPLSAIELTLRHIHKFIAPMSEPLLLAGAFG